MNGLWVTSAVTDADMWVWHKGGPGVWHATLQMRMARHSMRDRWACGLQTRVARHGMRDRQVRGLQMKAARHDVRKGQERGLQTRMGRHGGVA